MPSVTIVTVGGERARRSYCGDRVPQQARPDRGRPVRPARPDRGPRRARRARAPQHGGPRGRAPPDRLRVAERRRRRVRQHRAGSAAGQGLRPDDPEHAGGPPVRGRRAGHGAARAAADPRRARRAGGDLAGSRRGPAGDRRPTGPGRPGLVGVRLPRAALRAAPPAPAGRAAVRAGVPGRRRDQPRPLRPPRPSDGHRAGPRHLRGVRRPARGGRAPAGLGRARAPGRRARLGGRGDRRRAGADLPGDPALLRARAAPQHDAVGRLEGRGAAAHRLPGRGHRRHPGARAHRGRARPVRPDGAADRRLRRPVARHPRRPGAGRRRAPRAGRPGAAADPLGDVQPGLPSVGRAR
ncbi:hypothetical protein L7F22_009752 [Adiantum nelumboides]|nr:hypothetical protein [Adiantum nelumboides]